MKKQKARGQVRRFLRRSIACLLAIVGMGMAAVTAGLPQPLGWLGGLGGIQTAMAAQARAARNRARAARALWERKGEDTLTGLFLREMEGRCQAEPENELSLIHI